MAKYYTVVTEKGIEKLNTSIQTNKSFSATKMAVGDSNGSYYEPEKTQTELKNQKYIANCYAKGKRDNYLYFDLQLPPSVGDFYIREVGLFDNDLNLLAVAKYPETLKTSANGSLEKNLNIEIRIELSEEALKQVIIDEAGNLARIEELDKYQLLEEKNTANGYVGLNSESQIAHKHIPFAYNVFCVNTGALNDDGEAAFLEINENVLSTNGSFDITTANGKTYTISDVISLDITNLADDTYNLFIDPIAKTLSASNSTIFTGNKFPDDATVGDYLLNTAKIPYDLEQKTSDSVQKGLNAVFVGTLTISGGGKTVVMNKFNENILKEKIPTKTSELTNDSNYVDTAVMNTNLNKKVNKAGDTMSGKLNIKMAESVKLSLLNTNMDISATEAPSADLFNQVKLGDKNGNWTGLITNSHKSSTNVMETRVETRRKIDDVYKSVAIGVGVNNNGASYSFVSCHPDSASNGTNIATTKWVRDLLTNNKYIKDAPYIVEESDKKLLPSWYRVWSNGWCEQGSHQEGSFNQSSLHQFLKPYLDLNYTVVTTCSLSTRLAGKQTDGFYVNGQDGKYSGDTYTYLDWYACGFIN